MNRFTRNACAAARLSALSCFVLSLCSAARADQITIAPARDTTIYEEDGTVANGAGTDLFVGATSNGYARRALIAFDVAAALPAGTTINSATLRLNLSRTRASSQSIALHRMTAQWGEGSSNAGGNEGMGTPAADGDATWTHRSFPTLEWTAPGGDWVQSASASTSVGETEQYYSWTSTTMAQDVRDWLVDPAVNFGWSLIGNEGSGTTKRFKSRNAPSARPLLVIDYTPPAQTTGACCAADSSCSIRLDPGSDCVGDYVGPDTMCTTNTCPPPTGACCANNAAAECSVETRSQCMASSGSWLGAGTGCEADEHGALPCPVVLERFVDPLPVPALAEPVEGEPGGEARYEMSAVQLRHSMHRDLPETIVWGYSDGRGHASYPGPTILAGSGKPVHVRWINDLRDDDGHLLTAHHLAVDTCVHGAVEGPPPVVTHLHGGHVSSASDGQPELTLKPGEHTDYEYPNQQTAATLWYHDHALGITRLNVMMGLAGFYVLTDDVEAALDLPGGEYDIGLAIQDRSFMPDGSLRYPAMWQEHFFGETAVVNGKAFPYLDVKRGKYRFRVLNGATSRTWRLRLSNGAAFMHIGSDGGLLASPVLTGTLVIAPGERAEIVVDFSGQAAGTRITLTNDAPAPFPSGGDGVEIPEVMQFVVGTESGFSGDVPNTLRDIEPLDPDHAVQTRDFVLRRRTDGGGHHCGGSAWAINDLGWDDITEQPHLGTSEVWRFINRSGLMHPMHMHLVMFQVLDRQEIMLQGEEVVPVGEPAPVDSIERGWKDTVQVQPFEIVRVIARFEDFAGLFPYHCHILEHEDHEMMRQFEAVAVCGDGALARGYEECDDGNADDGDECDSRCHIGSGEGPALEDDAGLDDASAGSRDAGRASDAGVSNEGADDSSCGCRVVGRPTTQARAALVWSALLLAPVGRRVASRTRRRTRRR